MPTFIVHVECFQQICLDWIFGFEAESLHIRISIITWQSGQVNACDGLQKPGSLQK